MKEKIFFSKIDDCLFCLLKNYQKCKERISFKNGREGERQWDWGGKEQEKDRRIIGKTNFTTVVVR